MYLFLDRIGSPGPLRPRSSSKACPLPSGPEVRENPIFFFFYVLSYIAWSTPTTVVIVRQVHAVSHDRFTAEWSSKVMPSTMGINAEPCEGAFAAPRLRQTTS